MLGSKASRLQGRALLCNCHSTWSPHVRAHSFTQQKVPRISWAWLRARMTASWACRLGAHSQHHRQGRKRNPRAACISRGSRLSSAGHSDSLVSFYFSLDTLSSSHGFWACLASALRFWSSNTVLFSMCCLGSGEGSEASLCLKTRAVLPKLP